MMRMGASILAGVAGVLLMTGAALAQNPAAEKIALDNARSQLREQILATEVDCGVNVGDLLHSAGTLDELDRQLAAVTPVGGVRWVDNDRCQVRLELPGEAVAALLRKPLAEQTTRPANAALLPGISGRLYVSVGGSESLGSPATTVSAAAAHPTLVPQQAPGWVNNTVSAEAWVRSAGSPLLTARAAEKQALQSLRERVGALVLSYSTTLDEAARQEPAIGSAIERAMRLARVRQTDYGADGSATVRVELRLRYLWDELNR